MATVQEPRAGSRYESFVETELSRARRRIRSQDVGVAALGLLAGTLAYALGMILLDRWLILSDTARQVALFSYVAIAIAYAALVVSRPFRREVNPYYAARQVEQAVPGAKNSVISYLDLHDEPLPASIRQAVTQKAATDLKRADVDEVVRDGRLAWIGGVAGGLFVAALILFFLLRPNQFLSLLGRAFSPFSAAAIAHQTTLNLLQPAGGDVTIPVNMPVDFRVEVVGRVPDAGAADAVRLRFRYNPTDPVWEEIRLDPSPREPHEFAVRLPAGRVQNGFAYQIVGGDAATPEYRVQVRSSPLIEGFEVVYHFRPYLRFRDQTATNPNIEVLRGTQVTLTARTNRTVKSGVLEFQPAHDGQKAPPPLPAEAVADQPASLRFRFVPDEDATYKIRFQSAEDERNEDPIPYTIKVLSDHAPQVEVTHPAPDTLPVNGTITVEGKASDDFGITAMRLCMQLADAKQPTPLAPKPYRPGKVFKFADDTYPRTLDYKDFLPLDQLRTPLGAPVTLKPGLAIEYWLEAEDNCDYPKPNVGRSKVYKVTLADQQPADEKQAAEKQAAGDKAEHDQKQDKDLNRQNEEKKQQQQSGDKGDQGQPNTDKQEKPQEGDQQKPGENAQDQQLDKEMQKAKEALDRQQQREQQQDGKGEAKDNPQPKPGEQPMNPGEPKGEQGEKKDGNPQPNQPGQPKDQHGEAKSGQQQPNGNQGEPKPDNQPNPGEAKPHPNSQQPDQKQPSPNAQKQPRNNAGQQADQKQPNAQQPDQKQPKQPGDSAGQQPDQKQPNANAQKQPGDNAGQQPNQPNPGESKPQPSGGKSDAGEKKDQQPQAGQQPGEAKDSPGAKASDQKAGDNHGKPGGETNAGNPPNNNPQDSKPGQPNGTPPNQPPNAPGNTKPTTENRAPSDNPKKDADGSNSPPKPEPGNGGQPGRKDQPGERPGSGPKKDPNNQEPNGSPNPDDPGRDQGNGGKKGSGTPGGAPPKSEKPNEAPSGEGKGGTPELGQAKSQGSDKGEGKPSSGNAEDKKAGQPSGKPTGQGNLQDAPKAHEQAGGASKAQPKTDGTPSGGQSSGNKSNDQPAAADHQRDGGQSGGGQKAMDELRKLAQDLKSSDAQTRQAAENRVNEMAKELAKQANGQKPPDAKKMQDAAERAKEMLKQLDNDPAARQALEKAAKAAADEVAKEQLQKLAQDLKSDNAKTRDAAKEKAKQLAQGDLKPLADDAKSNDPQRQQAAKDALDQLGEKDPQARDALLQALKGDGKPGDQKDKPQTQAGNQSFGQRPDQAPPAGPAEPEPGPAAEPKFGQTTADLQLEKFPKNPSKELLKDLGMTEEQYRQFLKDAAELQKKRQAEAAKNRDRGAGVGKSAANTGAKRVQGGGDKPNQLERGGATLPPDEYRDGYKGFTEDVSKTGGGAKKD